MSDNEQDLFATFEPGEHNLLEDVQRSYLPYAHANRESLWRVQERLEARLQQTQQEKELAPSRSYLYNEKGKLSWMFHRRRRDGAARHVY